MPRPSSTTVDEPFQARINAVQQLGQRELTRFTEPQSSTEVFTQAAGSPAQQAFVSALAELRRVESELEREELDEAEQQALEARRQALQQQIQNTPEEVQQLTRFSSFQGATKDRVSAFERLRDKRDRLLNETLANNVLQQAAAPALRALGQQAAEFGLPFSQDANLLDALENVGKGAAIGSVVIPDDAAVDPDNPMPALQTASLFLGAAAEGALTDYTILSGLNMVRGAALARNAPNLARSADRALNLFGQGENTTAIRQMIGGGALAATSEIALQAASLKNPEQIIQAAGLVGVGGAALGGAVASLSRGVRVVKATPRSVRAFSEGFAERASDDIQEAILRGADEADVRVEVTRAAAEEQGQFAANVRQGLDEQGIRPRTEYMERLDRAGRAIAQARKLGEEGAVPAGREQLSPDIGRTQNARIEGMFDRNSPERFVERIRRGFDQAVESFKDSFEYEARLKQFPSLTGSPELTMADDVRVLQHGVNKSARDATKDLQNVVAPLREFSGLGGRQDFKTAWRTFERLIVLRDLAESAEKGLQLPLNLTADDISRELLRMESNAPKQVLQAAENHRQFVNEMRDDLIRRGKLEVGDGFENYFPHRIIDDLAEEEARITGRPTEEVTAKYPTSSALKKGGLKEPSRPYTRRREGSAKEIQTNYIDVMHAAVRRFHMDNVIDDFLQKIADSPMRLSRSDLTEEELERLIKKGDFIREGQKWQRFYPKGPAYYRAQAVNDEAMRTLVDKVKVDTGVDLTDMPEVRDVLAVGRAKEFILPAELADRLEQFHQPDPLSRIGFGPARFFRRITAAWKRNTIWWGLNRFFMFQLTGDSINLLRDNPAAFVQIRNGKLDSPVLRAIREQFRRYGTPIASKEQIIASAGGGVGGLTLDEAFAEDQDPSVIQRAASVLAGAGLGYLIGTRRVAGTRAAFSQIYEEADRLAAVNSGFTFSEEEVSRRLLGESASHLPDQPSEPWKRSLDSFSTLITGKARGNPYAPFRIPAETIEVVQKERENFLRLASYMQQIEQGISPEVAAKRARESLIDYGKFTDFENKVLRGFLLPFYAFHRHNIPNWIKTTVGKGPGGKATVGMAAVGAIAAADLATQVWNETFFPEVERSLQDFRRDRFHIIVGDPNTGTPYTDVKGQPMVVGWDMPYEEALEMFGLARPGVIYSELFGLGGKQNRDLSLIERGQRKVEDAKRLKSGPGKLALDLLTPFIKEPIQISTNKDFFYDAPIVPERYLGTEAEEGRFREHIVETFFRQYREFKRIGGRIRGKRFDPLTSAVGLGLPITRVNLDREIQGFIHETIDEASLEVKKIEAEWRKVVDDVIYDRERFTEVPEGEYQQVVEEVNKLGLPPNQTEKALRYYMRRGGKGSLTRRWEALSSEEKVAAWNRLPKWAQTALVHYVNFGEGLGSEIAPAAGGPSVTGSR